MLDEILFDNDLIMLVHHECSQYLLDDNGLILLNFHKNVVYSFFSHEVLPLDEMFEDGRETFIRQKGVQDVKSHSTDNEFILFE